VTSDERRQLALLLGVSFFVLAAGLGLRSPWPPDEPRFALIARDMAVHGNWLLPTVGGVLYPDKPPLFFWVVAVLYRVVRSAAPIIRPIPGPRCRGFPALSTTRARNP
jgi:4-amino-4-deoxy-L-arabinose transferase-like glycosyltransferase